MKKLCSLLALALVGLAPAHAQLFQPNQVRGGIIGAVAGALIGGHNHDRWAEGAALGAVAGTLVGTVADRDPYASPAPVTGAVVGGIAGAAIGNANGRHGVEGAIIGAAAGYGIGAAVSQPTTSYGYGQARVVETAPCVPAAPVVTQQVVYVQPAPARVVRVVPAPRVVYVAPSPVVVVSGGHHGRRYHHRRW